MTGSEVESVIGCVRGGGCFCADWRTLPSLSFARSHRPATHPTRACSTKSLKRRPPSEANPTLIPAREAHALARVRPATAMRGHVDIADRPLHDPGLVPMCWCVEKVIWNAVVNPTLHV